MLEFTDDQAKIQETLLLLKPHPIARGATSNFECPSVSYYMGDLLINHEDREAWQTAIEETYACANLDPRSTPPSVPKAMVQAAAQQALSNGSHETRVSLDVLGKIVRRISAMPGQRSIILASPGFLTLDGHLDASDVITKAIRAKVIIGTLDARGLWTEPGYSAADSTPPGGPNVLVVKSRYGHFEALAQEDVLAEIAASTGGTFIHNTNDLAGGFQRLGAAPEFVYVIGFTPTNLKSDGKFHGLKIALKDSTGLSLQARRGYYAPKREAGAAEQARQDIEDAIFSREVMKDIPVELHTQFFKPSDTEAKLSVLARVDVKRLKYRLDDGRYRDSLKVVTALFDPSGNFVVANEKVIDFRLLEATLEKRLNNGLTVKTSFDVKAGSYVVRLVVRDSEGQTMAAENGAVEIP
jgi:VWFA-related protein